MNSATASEPGARAGLIDTLRRFHYGEPVASASTRRPEGGILPALLNPYRDAGAIRYEYPLYLAPAGSPPDTPLVLPLSEHLANAVLAFAPGDDTSRILKDNLPWLERYLRQHLAGAEPVDGPALFDEAASALTTHLDLRESHREALDGDLAALRAAIVDGSRFLGYGPHASLHVLVHEIAHSDGQRRHQLQETVKDAIRSLGELVQVEAAKKGDGAAASDTGTAAQHVDTELLSDMLGKRSRGTKAMPADRRARIEETLGTLRDWDEDPVLVSFVGRLEDPALDENEAIEVIANADPCARAGEVFEQHARRYARLFIALRIATLEKDDRYDPSVHDSWFASFDWQAFSDEELQCVPRVVALVSADQLAGEGLPSFSRLLGSRCPVHVVSWVRAYDNPAVRPGESPFDAYRFELAYLGIGHRHVVVAQTSAARHADMVDGFRCALRSNRGSLHLINRGTQTRSERPILEPWFVASAALESRAHPFLIVDPGAGDHAAQRIRFGGNPQPEADWPVDTLQYAGADGETRDMQLAFTFADYALLMPALHEHFRLVPAECDSADLVPVAAYLDRDDESVERLVPFVWGIDDKGELFRLAVSRALVFACRDRLNYWHTLQELAGIHNFYVEEAVEKVLEDARAAAEAERDELVKAHAQALEEARSEAAGEAMGQLVDVLMGADLSSMVSGAPLARMPSAEEAPAEAPVEEPAAEEAAAEAPEEEEEALSFDEPWLDTASCTTCDDCMNINKMMFAYNEDKQAYLKDPRAGTYADLVAAAEICPAKCIHPGKPLDPNEPGLEELIARAEPFN
jgi:hypothetical protein